MALPEQTDWLLTDAETVGIGLTVISKLSGVPVQPFAEGVTVKVTITGALVVLINVPLIVPEPLAAMPVTEAELRLVHL